MTRSHPAGGVFLVMVLFAAAGALAGEHPVETGMKARFPAISLQSSATFDAADAYAGGRMLSGLRAQFPRTVALTSTPHGAVARERYKRPVERSLDVLYPRSYDEPIVVESGEQRLVLRAVAASPAFANETNGKLLYERPHPFTDVIEIPGASRSEELLLLHDRRAPRVYEWEIVETRGIDRVVVTGGAIRFVRDAAARSGRFVRPPASLQIDRPWVVDAEGKRSDEAAQWTLDGDVIRLTLKDASLAYPLVIDPSFSVTGSMLTWRYLHSSTLLPDGKVLIAGGSDGERLASAELYDPLTGTFTLTGSMTMPRAGHTATLLPNGTVYIAGGENDTGDLSTAELYDPATGTFTTTGNLKTTRDSHTATLLGNGKVLIRSGVSAELYDPATGLSDWTGAPPATRYSHTAVLLPNGRVLIAGGVYFVALTTAELYDPATGTFTPTGSLTAGRVYHTATVLANGKVLITGGNDLATGAIVSAELYDPAAGTFAATGNMTSPRELHTVTVLPNGKALVAGGYANPEDQSSAELFDPGAGTFTATDSMSEARQDHVATLLPNGRVLIAGGLGRDSADLYDSDAGTFSDTGDLPTGRWGLTATLLANGKVLVAGGADTATKAEAHLYDPALGTFASTGSLGTARVDHTATLLANGKVLIAGGNYCCGPVTYASAELFDPSTGTFTATGSMTGARRSHSATLLTDGRVLIVGGWNNSAAEIVASAELYDPSTGTFSTTGGLAYARVRHTATLLTSGKVLIAGGMNFVDGSLDVAELYDPATGTFSVAGTMVQSRDDHTATLLADGRVLLAAGGSSHSGCCLSSSELYDPASGTFAATGNLSTIRNRHAASILANGKVLIAGGETGDNELASAELYDPVAGTFSPTGDLLNPRLTHELTLLLNGKVLVVGGFGSVDLASAELYDPGQGFSESRRPVISSSPSTQAQPGTMSLGGSGFRGHTEGSSGTSNNSATNYPLLHLQRVDNDQTLFVRASASWSDSSFVSASLTGLPRGHYRVTIVTNGIPSLQRMISFDDPGPSPTVSITNVMLSEGNSGTTTATFTVSLSAPGAVVQVTYATADGTATSGGASVANGSPITIPAGGNATPYPSIITTSGLTGTVAKIMVTLNDLTHTWPSDVDVLLVGPEGQSVILMSDAGNDVDLSGVDITFDDAAESFLPSFAFAAGTYKPTDIADGDGGDNWSSPAPPSGYSSTLSAFNGTSPNGTWSLFVVDDVNGDSGSFAGGWSLIITTSAIDYVATSGTLTFPMGTTSRTIAVDIVGDTTAEAHETFFVNLNVSGTSNATLADGQGQATITNDDTPAAPANVVALAATPTSVNITWTAAMGASSYRVYRGQRSGGVLTYSLVGSPSGAAFTDAGASANTSYLYKVRSFGPSESGDSNPDLATTIIFTDPTLTANVTSAKAIHFTEALSAVNAVRSLAGLGTIAFTAPAPAAGVSVRRQHMVDLRSGLDAARNALALSALTYTDPTITASATLIKAAHMTEVRDGVK